MAMAAALVFGATALTAFPCTPPSNVPPEPASDVSQVHPAHVSVMMAFGDSITAAFSARSNLDEARDISWCIGKGYSDQLTTPYIFDQYRSATAAGKLRPLEGMSTKPVLPHDITHLPKDDYHPETDHLNFAESEGAVHRGSLVEQWGFAGKYTPKIADFDDRWKVATVWMTANDVCGECTSSSATDGRLKLWQTEMNEFLVNVTTSWKKVYVNLMGTFNLSNVARVQRANLECDIEHRLIDECGCIDRGNSTELKLLDANTHLFNNALANLSSVWTAKLKASGRTDVAVVYQDFMAHGIGEELERSYLSELDCFHPSAKAHQSLAIGLWDAMVCDHGPDGELCGKKATVINPTVQCANASTTLWIPQ